MLILYSFSPETVCVYTLVRIEAHVNWESDHVILLFDKNGKENIP